MKKDNFYTILKEKLEIENFELNENTNLSSKLLLDSMASLILLTIADENFGVMLTPDNIKEITTFSSLMYLIGYEYFV